MMGRNRKTNNRYLSEKDFDIFVEKLKFPKHFLDICEKFHDIEKRDIIYVLAYDLLNSGKQKRLRELAAADIILMIWNMPWYQRYKKDKKIVLDDKILDIIRNNKDEIKKRGSVLNEFNENDKKFTKDIFEKINDKIETPVGTSKLLHILNPEAFPIWDNKIARTYHKYRHHKHKSMTSACYVDFCIDCKKILTKLSEKMSAEDIWKKHKEGEHLKEVLSEFPNFNESLLKMLDECNYVEITEKLRN